MQEQQPTLTVHVLEPHRLVRTQLRALRISLALNDRLPWRWAAAMQLVKQYDKIIADMDPAELAAFHAEMRRQARYLIDEVRHGR